MEADRMVIKAKDGQKKLVVAQDNVVRDAAPCMFFTDAMSSEPECNCQPCWDKWLKLQSEQPKEQ